MQLRPFESNDAERLAALYRDSVRRIGSRAYTPEQVSAWARYPEDLDAFRATLAQGMTLVAEVNGVISAFGQLHPWDHIAYLYCAGVHVGKGHASAIYAVLEKTARARNITCLHVEASRLARPFFERKGYRVLEVEYPIRHGVVIERFKMEKRMGDWERNKIRSYSG